MQPSKYNRRKFITQGSKATMALGIGLSAANSLLTGCTTAKPAAATLQKLWFPNFTQAALPYAFEALEPFIDKETMNIHYTKHAATYTKNLTDAITAEQVDSSKTNIIQLLENISKYSPKMRNNAGGHYNHELFWKLMKANGEKKPNGKLLLAIEKNFGSFEAFKMKFEDAGKGRFGSGWVWLVAQNNGSLSIGSTPNQDNPIMNIAEIKGVPLLALDVWEHAYYLKYQNKRADYITNWWNVVNWAEVQNRFEFV